ATLVAGPSSHHCQMVSYGMRRLALSMNQFGLDMLRAMERAVRDSALLDPAATTALDHHSYSFCPFCIGSSLAMLMAGLKASHNSDLDQSDSAGESLRYALYLNSMQQQEINLAFFDLMRHLQVNLPDGFRSRRSATSGNLVRIIN